MQRQYFKKEYIFISAWIMLLVICYQLAFKRTIRAWQLNEQLKSQLAQSSDLSIQPGYAERQNTNLDHILNLYKADTMNFRSNTITKISSVAAAENAKLAEVPRWDPVYSNGQFLIQKLDFEGDYFSLMRAFQRLGKTAEAGVIRSAVVRASRESNGDKKLIMELYFEINK
jgi:hypothetical protein